MNDKPFIVGIELTVTCTMEVLNTLSSEDYDMIAIESQGEDLYLIRLNVKRANIYYQLFSYLA